MAHTENPGSKGGTAVIINLRTTSTTGSFTEGGLVAIDSDGYAEMCATAETTNCIGVAANGLPTLDAARQRNMAVQVGGVATVYGWHDSTWTTVGGEAIVPGEAVGPSGDSNSTYTGQVVSNMDATNECCIGVALEKVATSGTRYGIKVLLRPRGGV